MALGGHHGVRRTACPHDPRCSSLACLGSATALGLMPWGLPPFRRCFGGPPLLSHFRFPPQATSSPSPKSPQWTQCDSVEMRQGCWWGSFQPGGPQSLLSLHTSGDRDSKTTAHMRSTTEPTLTKGGGAPVGVCSVRDVELPLVVCFCWEGGGAGSAFFEAPQLCRMICDKIFTVCLPPPMGLQECPK